VFQSIRGDYALLLVVFGGDWTAHTCTEVTKKDDTSHTKGLLLTIYFFISLYFEHLIISHSFKFFKFYLPPFFYLPSPFPFRPLPPNPTTELRPQRYDPCVGGSDRGDARHDELHPFSFLFVYFNVFFSAKNRQVRDADGQTRQL